MNFNIRDLIETSRPSTSLLGASAPLAAIIAVRGLAVNDIAVLMLCSVAVVFLFTMARNSLNDYNDYAVDKVNRPDRPIPSGRIAKGSVLSFSMLLFSASYGLAVILAFYTNVATICIVSLAFLIEFIYEYYLKKKKIVGNYIIGVQSSLAFIFGGYMVGEVMVPAIIAVAALFCITGREIVKDIEDMKGDSDRVTIPSLYGVKNAISIAFGLISVSIIVGFLPFILFNYGFIFLVIMIIADCVILLSFTQIDNPNDAQKILKYGMAIAILSFIIGGVSHG
jgi:geranylgeranylglycerol-phosphate geranylgeranyltransferase